MNEKFTATFMMLIVAGAYILATCIHEFNTSAVDECFEACGNQMESYTVNPDGSAVCICEHRIVPE